MKLPISEIFEFVRNGLNVKHQLDSGGLPVTRIETIADTTINLQRVGYAGVSLVEAKQYLLKDGDILFSHINSVEHLGKCAIYKKELGQLVHGMNLLCFRVKADKLFPKYALYLIRSSQFKNQLAKSIKKSVNQASVSTGDIKKIILEVPPLAEQQRIAELLDTADRIFKLREQAIAKLDALAQSVFANMFLGGNWASKCLMQLGTVKTGRTPSSAKNGMFGTDIPFVTPGDLQSKSQPKRYLSIAGAAESVVVKKGSALVCCIGATIGKMDKAKTDSAFNQQLNAVEWGNEINEDYGIFALLNIKNKIVNGGIATTLPILKKSLFEKLEIKVPPINLQTEFSQYIAAIEEQKKRCVRQLEAASVMTSSLQSQSFATN